MKKEESIKSKTLKSPREFWITKDGKYVLNIFEEDDPETFKLHRESGQIRVKEILDD